MSTAADAERYVTDVPYARRFVRELSPAWLDFTALICGFRPPPREAGFAWCELGCGNGVTPALLAAMHPNGRFTGIDLMDDHIAFAEQLGRDAGLGNAAFHALDFAAATELDLPRFDYIVAHGVYTWVDETAQADLIRFVDRHLKPGGLLYLSYNCLPGWAADMPLQHLLLALAQQAEGDGIARLAAADRIVTAAAEAGATVLREGAVGREWAVLREQLPASYFAHEFLPPAWRPLYVTDVRRATAAIGLTPLGSATIRENIDAFTLAQPAQELVAGIADAGLRELLRDYLLMKRFRRDVFGRLVPGLDSTETRRRIAATRFMPAPLPATGAEPLAFGNATAQRILALLESGPQAPNVLLAEGHGIEALVAQTLALVSAGRIWPVDTPIDSGSGRDTVAAINAVLRSRIGGPHEIAFLALPDGTAVELGAEALQHLRNT